MTDVERAIWTELRAHRFSRLKFKRQQALGDYVVDFICFEKKLVIELDGGQHGDQMQYDQARDEWLSRQGFRVLRFWNNDVLTNRSGVLVMIAEACGVLENSPSPPAGCAPLATLSPQGERGEDPVAISGDGKEK